MFILATSIKNLPCLYELSIFLYSSIDGLLLLCKILLILKSIEKNCKYDFPIQAKITETYLSKKKKKYLK